MLNFSVIFLDISFSKQALWFDIIGKYCTPLLQLFISLYVFPYLVFMVVQNENHERKSTKESSYMSKNLFYMLLNCIVVPLIAFSVYTYLMNIGDLGPIDVDYNAPKYPESIINSSSIDLDTYVQQLVNTQSS